MEINSKPYYVLLTGSKNNAGDYLIKYRAKELLSSVRSDREFIDIDAWKPFDSETLALVNKSKALILMGGPALQKNMYPGIYPLCENLDEIKVPIITMGIGWKSLDGAWKLSRNYPLNKSTRELLARIESSGFKSSIRDYHTLNSLQHIGLRNFVMTGCPAFNDLEHLKDPKLDRNDIKKIGFSLGVSFLESSEMLEQMRSTILGLRRDYSNAKLEVIFHHSLKEDFLKTHNATNKHLVGHRAFVDWLEEKGIGYVDISGSADNLVNYYSNVDLHVGYRVHAHIFMTSIGKRSLLIAEDGRGKAVKLVMNGLVMDGVDGISKSIFAKVFRKLNWKSGYAVSRLTSQEILNQLAYEVDNSYPRIRKSQILLKDNFETMKEFVLQLP